MTDVKQGRSSRQKPDPVSTRELKVRTPDKLEQHQHYEQRNARRAERLAELAAWHEARGNCPWCGRPVGDGRHGACEEALGRPVGGPDGTAAQVGPGGVPEAPGASQRPAGKGPGGPVSGGPGGETAARRTKLATKVVDTDVVLDGEVWRTVLFTEVTEDGVIAETTRFDGEDWVTVRWGLDEQVTWRRA